MESLAQQKHHDAVIAVALCLLARAHVAQGQARSCFIADESLKSPIALPWL